MGVFATQWLKNNNNKSYTVSVTELKTATNGLFVHDTNSVEYYPHIAMCKGHQSIITGFVQIH